MSAAPQIHIFFGAPSLPASLKTSKEERFSASTAEKWQKLYFSFPKDTFKLCTRKYTCLEHVDHRTPNDTELTAQSKDHFPPDGGKEYALTDVILTDCRAGAGRVKLLSNEAKHLPYQQLLTDIKTGEPSKQSEDAEGGTSRMHNHLTIPPLASSTERFSRGLESIGQDDKPDVQCAHYQLLNQYLEGCFPQVMKESKAGKPLNVYSNLPVSTETEFLSILTSSQVALLSGGHAVGQNETQSKSTKASGTELDGLCREDEASTELHIQLNENGGLCANITDTDSSLELFDFDSTVKSNSYLRENSFQENADMPTDHLCSSDDKPKKEVHYIEPWKKGILCSQVSHSTKRSQTSEDISPATYMTLGDQQQSKKAKLICSPVCAVPQIEQLRISGFKKVLKHPSLLKDCLCKGQKYTVLVTVLHPCHIKEIQTKPGPKLSSRVPLATVIVFDQSEVQRKIALWRAAAFWSLTMFPGDIVLFTDVIINENRWNGEILLQSTFTSRLLNLGSCSTINQNKFSHIVDVNILQDLLAYVSSKQAYLQALPQRQTQTLNNIQHIQLDQLKPDRLVHAIVKIINITVLSESTYSYKGETKRKIILTVEQMKDQHYVLVLWGALSAHCPQLQRKRDHIWEFKYLFVKHSPISGELELHTTPWTSLECLFDDDRRAIEFKEKFQKDVRSLMGTTTLAALLEEKCSGMIQVKACISELKFAVASSPHGQLVFDYKTSLQQIFASLTQITYAGCAKCGLELQIDDNKIYKQCVSCLPSNKVKIFYRPALMTVEDGKCDVSVQVASELMEKMFLNIPAEWLNKAIAPSLETTYGMIVADLCHSLLTDTQASYILEIRSHFVLDENSYPLEKTFNLLDFHLDL
ncbi:shieldin complex subunit 2 [Podarcis muralis]